MFNDISDIAGVYETKNDRMNSQTPRVEDLPKAFQKWSIDFKWLAQWTLSHEMSTPS